MIRKLSIYRGHGETGRFETFEVDLGPQATLLDALEYLRTGKVQDLVYRHSCHHGSCGTCSVRINGQEKLACLTPLESLYTDGKDTDSDIPKIEALLAFEPIADLAIDPGRLFRSIPEGITHVRESEWINGKPVAPGKDSPTVHPSGIDKYERFEDCIECGSCVSACPVTARDWPAGFGSAVVKLEQGGPVLMPLPDTPPFIGPAALAALHRETINKSERREELLAVAAQTGGVNSCERHFECSRVCPRGVAPGKHIELLRREIREWKETP